ncbi:hypothetical protein YTPLAS18_35440 [Nitrospira sp.]|nr:hypothetical protein YTPLAS18_35440 [Nitrospira sp.]
MSLAALSPVTAAPPPSKSGARKALVPRSLSFTLENDTVTGTIPFGSELVLGIVLHGREADHSLVAVVEGPAIDKIMVPMQRMEGSTQWKAQAVIKPHPLGYTSVRPKALWVRVTVAQERNSTLLRLIGRTAYLTMAHEQQDLSADSFTGDGEHADARIELVVSPPTILGDEIQPDVMPVANALIAEEDLQPLPEVRGQQAYWTEIARLISQSWGQKVRYAKNVKSARETVRIAFRMHSNGEAQLIQVERTSGVRDVDEAGLQAIVQAHPFPPFKDTVGEEVVDVHVRMRTGAKRAVVVQEPPGPASVGVTAKPSSAGKATDESRRTSPVGQ